MALAAHGALPLWADVVIVLAAATGTALATGLGAIPVIALGARAAGIQPFLWALAAGLMSVAAVVGLLAPAIEDGDGIGVLAGSVGGVAFFLASRRWVDRRRDAPGRAGSPRRRGSRDSALVIGVLLVHSLPEGLALGTAYGAGADGVGLFVMLAIALQNVPEGTAAAIPLHAEGAGGARQFWTAVATSMPQPLGAAVAVVLVEEVRALLPVSLAFAAGAMLALVALELGPKALVAGRPAQVIAGAALGAALMLGLAAALAP